MEGHTGRANHADKYHQDGANEMSVGAVVTISCVLKSTTCAYLLLLFPTFSSLMTFPSCSLCLHCAYLVSFSLSLRSYAHDQDKDPMYSPVVLHRTLLSPDFRLPLIKPMANRKWGRMARARALCVHVRACVRVQHNAKRNKQELHNVQTNITCNPCSTTNDDQVLRAGKAGWGGRGRWRPLQRVLAEAV